MANSPINGNDALGASSGVWNGTRGTQPRQRNSILGEAASQLLSHPTASRNDQQNVYVTDDSFHRSAYSRTSLSQRFTSIGKIHGASPTMFDISGGRPWSSREDIVGANASMFSQSRTNLSQRFTSTGKIHGASPTMFDISGGRPRSSREDLIGANASMFLQSNEATNAATTSMFQNSTYSRIGSSPSTQSATANTTGTPMRTESYRYVTPENGSSQVTVFPSYQNHY